MHRATNTFNFLYAYAAGKSPGFPPVQHKHCIISHAQEIAHPHIQKYTLSPDSTVTARALAILATVYGREGEDKRIETPQAHSCYHSNDL